jgi:hypothetical protein
LAARLFDPAIISLMREWEVSTPVKMPQKNLPFFDCCPLCNLSRCIHLFRTFDFTHQFPLHLGWLGKVQDPICKMNHQNEGPNTDISSYLEQKSLIVPEHSLLISNMGHLDW